MFDLLRQYWRACTFVLFVIVTFASLWPLPELPIKGSDKVGHFIAYACLVFPVSFAKPKHWLWVVLALALYGGFIELVQPYVNRYGEWLDWLANLAGVGLGVSLARGMAYFSKLSVMNE